MNAQPVAQELQVLRLCTEKVNQTLLALEEVVKATARCLFFLIGLRTAIFSKEPEEVLVLEDIELSRI